MKLFYHLFGYLLVGMILLIGTDEYLSFQSEIKQFEADMIANALQNGKSISAMITHVWEESGESTALDLLEDASQSGTIRIRWVWPDNFPDNALVATEEKLRLQKLNLQETSTLKVHDPYGETLLYTYMPVTINQETNGALELQQTFSSLQIYEDRVFLRAILVTVALALVCGGILYLFIHYKIRIPLGRLIKHAQQIERGDFRGNHSLYGNDELATLAKTMNDMCASMIIAKEKIKFEYEARLKTLEQLRHTERLSTFGLISAGIAHEIGTPLNVVDGRAKMIISEKESTEESKECATIIKKQAERMTLIIRQLLDFTRRPKQHISSENIAMLIKQIFQLLHPMAGRQKVVFSLHRADDTEVVIQVDGSQIQQVLINLLMNSIQAMPHGGTISVSITNEVLSGPQVEPQKPQPYVKIRIEDEGEGISKENLKHIFTPFFTTKTLGTGTGLGLSIAHGIVEEHGGWIEVESNLDNGACFSVYLPMLEKAS